MSEIGVPTLGRIAFAVVHHDPPDVYVAENEEVLSRVLGLHVVAATPGERVSAHGRGVMKQALLEEAWDTAVSTWIEETGTVVDVFPDEDLWTEDRLSADRASFEFRMSPLFADT